MTEPNDVTEVFVRLLTRHEAELRAFIRSCLPRPADVDEVMQEVSLAAWKKFPTLTERELFPRWACLIARYEILAFRRRHARDRLVFDEDVIQLMAEEGAEEMPRRRQQLDALDECIAKLPRAQCELLLACYAPGVSIRSLAGRFRRTEGALYQFLARIRRTLHECVQTALARQGELA